MATRRGCAVVLVLLLLVGPTRQVGAEILQIESESCGVTADYIASRERTAAQDGIVDPLLEFCAEWKVTTNCPRNILYSR